MTKNLGSFITGIGITIQSWEGISRKTRLGLVGGDAFTYPENPVGWVAPLGLQVSQAARAGASRGAGSGALVTQSGSDGIDMDAIIAMGLLPRGRDEAMKLRDMTREEREAYIMQMGRAEELTAAHKAAVAAGTKTGATGYGGDCSPKDFDKLNAEQENACKDKGSGAQPLGGCFDSMSPIGRATHIKMWTACAKARKNIADKCFVGGDDGHRQQIAQALAVVTKCGGTLPW